MNAGFSDQEVSLIPGTQSQKSFVSPVAVCFVMKILPFLTYFFLSLFEVEDSVVSVVTLIFLFIEFMFIKYVSGFSLVGLKWSIDLSSMSFRWYSKPEPFVPVLSNTNFFWMSFFISLAIWLICFFIALFSSTNIKAITSLLGFICEGVNFYMFSKAHNYAKKQVEKAVLNSIQDDVHFDLVPENDIVNNDTKNQQKNESHFLPKKTSKVLDTTSVELPPPLMPAKTASENKAKNEEEEEKEKEKVISNPDHEISNDNTANINEKENDDKNNDEDDIDFY